MTNSIVFIFVFIISISFFFYNVRRLFSYLKLGREEYRTDKPFQRLMRVFVVAFGQTKLLREPLAGLMHFFIFWGFVVLFSAIIESIGEGFYSGFSFSFLGTIHPPLILLQELFALLVVVSILYAFIRRIILKPKRFENHSSAEAYFILTMILFIMLSMYGQSATKMLMHQSVSSANFVSANLLPLFSLFGIETQTIFYHIFWWIHVGLVLVFLNYLPYSKHLHVLTSIPNVYFSKLTPKGALKTINLSDETLTKFGASDVEDFTWKQLLDSYTCTECGRCVAVCPANLTGKPLSPRKIFEDMRHRLIEKGPIWAKNNRTEKITELQSNLTSSPKNQLVDDYISEDELWACTTCMACMEECPVMIEHVDSIIEMRRYLVLNESRFPKELQVTFQNLERNYTPWAFSSASRADWAEGLDVPVFSQTQDAEILFWVGCAGSFDERAKSVTRAIVKILQKADVKFAILGNEEKCTGDSARRAGNEYLAQMLINENVTTLNKYNIRKIVTACPHCLNALKNEYPQFGGNYEVVHHTDFILNLIKNEKIRVSANGSQKITYHDSCYLGRYNDVYDSPRGVIENITGDRCLEMKRSKDKGFCCGAGGSRMFMEENIGKRVYLERTEEALALNPDIIGTACPFCLTMLTDGVKDKEASDKVSVKDIAELVAEALEN
ncbi:MAG: (Fe-S)-binding protein [Bacteroidota bacterium]|nr:(Fe-S)-binding protein [Bacteroidota bacterium]